MPYANLDRAVAQFLRLVQIDSPTGFEHALADEVERSLRALGLEAWNDRSGPDGRGNVIAVLPGERGRPIALSAHLDTVEPGRGIRPQIVAGVVRSDGTTVLGADCKVGLAAILEALTVVVERGLPHGRVETLITYGEERGHQGAKTLDLGPLRAEACFVADAIFAVGTIIASAPGYNAIAATLRGRAAHAGQEPEKGISAIVVAADAVRRMRLGRLDAETTANVGLIRGGSSRNTVPELVTLEAEARSRDAAKLEAATRQIVAALEGAAADHGASAEVTITTEYAPYRLAADDPRVVLAWRAAERAGLRPRLAATGGGSDANTFNERGLPSVALGTGMALPHTLAEHVALAEIGRLADLLVALILEASA